MRTGTYGNAAEEVLGVARRVKQYGLPRNTFLNVNVPCDADRRLSGYRITTQALQRSGEERFAETPHPSGRTIYWNVYKEAATAPEGTDIRGSQRRLRVGDADEARRRRIPRSSKHWRAIFK